MNILLCGADSNYAIERHYLKYFKQIVPGNVELFTAQNLFLQYYHSSIINKVLFRLGFQKIFHNINFLLLEKVEEFKPDIIFVFKGMEIYPETLVQLKKKGIKLVNYNPDNPFIFTGRGSGNKNISKSIILYDLHFTYNLEIQKLLIEITNKPVEFLPFGYDLSFVDMNEILNEPEILKPCFLGNPDKDRAYFIKELNRQGIHLDLYGNGWHKFASIADNTIFPAVYGLEFYKVLRRYRVQLNIMRIHNLQSHNMRTFEIPAIGGVQLAPDTPEHRMFFNDGKEIFLYKDDKQCAQMVKGLLLHSAEKAKTFRENALQRSETSGYSYKDRACFALQKLNSI